jgi:hypothetical protein
MSVGTTLMIGGTGRSGTTVLARAFAAHPDVATIPEIRLLTDPDGLLDFLSGYEAWSPFIMDGRLRRLERFFRDLRREGRVHGALRRLNAMQPWIRAEFPHSRMRIDDACPRFHELGDALVSRLSEASFAGEHASMRFGARKRFRSVVPELTVAESAIADFLRGVADSALRHQGGSWFLEKNTWTFLHLDKVLRLMPSARMVHVVRHPCDVVASFTKQRWMPSDPMLSAAVLRGLLARWRQARAAVPPTCVLEVSLERICADPRGQLGRICDWWGIPHSDEVFSVDFSRGNAGRWRSDIAERLHGPLIASLGRELDEYEAIHSRG